MGKDSGSLRLSCPINKFLIVGNLHFVIFDKGENPNVPQHADEILQ